MTPIASFLWRRLDQPGHDCCRLARWRGGWRLDGMATFREGRLNCQVQYRVVTDRYWRTRQATIAGSIGHRPLQLRIVATTAGWQLNGGAQHQVAPLPDLDLGFTPATNLIPVRRLRLAVGEYAEAPAAYLEFPRLRLVELPQTYRRLDRERYDYRSPSTGYHGILRISSHGAVIDYPRVFSLEGVS